MLVSICKIVLAKDLSKIYKILGNEDLSKKISNPDTRLKAINTLKKEVTGISQKEES